MTVKEQILRLLAHCEYPHTSAEIAGVLRLDKRQVQNRMGEMRRLDGLLVREGNGYRVAA